MSWRESTVLKERREFIAMADHEDCNFSQLCERYGISRKTGYKWLKRDQAGGALHDQSRRPKHSPLKSVPVLEERVLEVRDRHPAWGGRKISHVLLRDRQIAVAPSTVTHILHRYGRIDEARSEAAKPWKRFEHEAPNHLWQMDFKGHFALREGRCHPLTVLDDHSRFNLLLQACADERRETVQIHLQRCFEQYGLPWRIQTDNGPPWGGGALTQLGVWLIRLGVGLIFTPPRHPQSNGKDERFHRTLKAEVLCRIFADMVDAQSAMDFWRTVYNHVRPHEAILMQTPSQRYRPSPRSFPAHLPPIEYAPDDLVRRVQQGGWISFKGHDLRVSKALIGQPVALRPRLQEDGCFDLFFCHQWIDFLDLSVL
jgi:transposase InsO family protein